MTWLKYSIKALNCTSYLQMMWSSIQSATILKVTLVSLLSKRHRLICRSAWSCLTYHLRKMKPKQYKVPITYKLRHFCMTNLPLFINSILHKLKYQNWNGFQVHPIFYDFMHFIFFSSIFRIYQGYERRIMTGSKQCTSIRQNFVSKRILFYLGLLILRRTCQVDGAKVEDAQGKPSGHQHAEQCFLALVWVGFPCVRQNGSHNLWKYESQLK